jgi:hypothetical protein
MQAHGATIGMHTLYGVVAASPRFAQLCHVTAHYLADAMYASMGNLGEAMALCREGCSYACQHAVLTSYLRSLPEGSAPDLIRLCPRNPQHPHSLSQGHCTHGVGHGLAHYYHDPGKALTACLGLSLWWEQRQCSKGVLMEWSLDIVATQSPPADPVETLSPCRTVEPMNRNDCYYYFAPLVAWAADLSFPAMFAACKTVTPDNRGCFRGIGRSLGGVYLHQEGEVIRMCRSVSDNEAAHCLLGFLGILTNLTGIDRGMAFCREQTEALRARCAHDVGIAVHLRFTDEDRIAAECAKAGESQYAEACRKADIATWDPYAFPPSISNSSKAAGG